MIWVVWPQGFTEWLAYSIYYGGPTVLLGSMVWAVFHGDDTDDPGAGKPKI